MPHFRVSVDPVAITITGAALGPDVFGSLKMARAALEAAVADEIDRAAANYDAGLEVLKAAFMERRRDLRAARDAALKVREDKLPSDASPSGPPVVPPTVHPDPQAPAEEADTTGAASGDQTIGQQMKEIGRQVEAGVKGEAA